MKKSLLKNVATLSLIISGLSANEASHWGYTGHNDPNHWGELSEKYKMCSDGKNQSPINIVPEVLVATKGLEPIKFDYKAKSTEVVNNGHTIQVNFEHGSIITIDGKEFELKQFHFHTPSENQINGKNFPLEGHFVHLDNEGNITVVAVMFDESKKDNDLLEKIWNAMPTEEAKKPFVISANDLKAILPDNKSYYRFDGSLTTPPCSEGVRWLVLKESVKLSHHEVEEFLHVMHHSNNRNVQKINARKVLN